MSEGKGGVFGPDDGFAKLLDRIWCLWVQHAEWRDEFTTSFVDDHSIEDVNLGLVNEKGFEEEGDYDTSFAEDEECCIKPGNWTVEDREEEDLGEICPEKRF